MKDNKHLFSDEMQDFISEVREAAFMAGWISASVIILIGLGILHLFGII